MKRSFLFILLLAIVVASCNVQQTPAPVSKVSQPSVLTSTSFPTHTATATHTPTQEATFTQVATRTITATLAPTLTPTITPTATLTPTYDPRAAITITPVPAAQCPVVNSGFQPVFADQTVDGYWMDFDLSEPILNALNQGAGLPALKHAITQATYDGHPAEIPPESIYEKDLTGDHVPEIIFDEDWLLIYGCHEGVYQIEVHRRPGTTNFIQKPLIYDMNQDGLNEVVALTWSKMNNVYELYSNILRWNGRAFVDLTNEQDFSINGNTKWSVYDTDGNGTLELVIRNWPPVGFDANTHGPYRYETYTYAWNGVFFDLQPMQLDPPEYRFQAVQDGDRAMRQKDYVRAIRFFQQAIDDPALKGWGTSVEHFLQRQQAYSDMIDRTPTPTPLPLDPNETDLLKAFAHYRILVAQAILENKAEAQKEYEKLQRIISTGDTGSVYAELGKQFWTSYIEAEDIREGCKGVISYAQSHEAEVLEPLNAYYGFQNIGYKFNDLCP